MGFQEDLHEHLDATGNFTVERTVGAVLSVISASKGAAVLVEPFDAAKGDMWVGFKEKGGKAAAKNYLRGSSVIGLFQRSAALSPTVKISVMAVAGDKVRVVTDIDDWAEMQSSFHRTLVGRDPHKAFLTDLGVALKKLDPTLRLRIGG